MQTQGRTLEGLFADEFALLQPTPGYIACSRNQLQIWKARKAAVREEIATAERRG